MLSRNKNVATILLVLLAAVAVAVAAGLLLVPEDQRTNKFWLALGAVLVALAVNAGTAVVLLLSRKAAETPVPVHFGTMVLTSLYGLGALVLAGVAATSIKFEWLLVLHLLAFLALVGGLAMAFLGGSSISQLQKEDRIQRAGLIVFRNRFGEVSERLERIGPVGVASLKKPFEAFREDLRFATVESLPGSEAVDAELNACLDEVEASLTSIEGVVATGEIDRQLLASAEKQIQRMHQVLRRRDALMAQLR